jgi:hypothetical protein
MHTVRGVTHLGWEDKFILRIIFAYMNHYPGEYVCKKRIQSKVGTMPSDIIDIMIDLGFILSKPSTPVPIYGITNKARVWALEQINDS